MPCLRRPARSKLEIKRRKNEEEREQKGESKIK